MRSLDDSGMHMNGKISDAWRHEPEDASEDVRYCVPQMTVGTLVNMMAVAKWVICDGERRVDPGFCRAVRFMEQLIYQQTYERAGADEVWQDPENGDYHHPTFPEQDGEAWRAMQQYDEEVFSLKLVAHLSRILADQDQDPVMTHDELLDHYEHRLLDVIESQGSDGLLRSLFAAQENS